MIRHVALLIVLLPAVSAWHLVGNLASSLRSPRAGSTSPASFEPHPLRAGGFDPAAGPDFRLCRYPDPDFQSGAACEPGAGVAGGSLPDAPAGPDPLQAGIEEPAIDTGPGHLTQAAAFPAPDPAQESGLGWSGSDGALGQGSY